MRKKIDLHYRHNHTDLSNPRDAGNSRQGPEKLCRSVIKVKLCTYLPDVLGQTITSRSSSIVS